MFKIGQKVVVTRDAFEVNFAEVKQDDVGVVEGVDEYPTDVQYEVKFKDGMSWFFSGSDDLLKAVDEED